ncbi:MAG: 4Fe-4S binding protein [Oscillospiraceae bacterium]|nr:4Fe-4S binding protein [Oscillospiraceae bacterium]MBQ7330136.1 4Fe-4S binding protein [Oscillospiraceae bacterium]MBQ7768269.1 4Fe-4S binding protein [Oscillospiraceae bacterium]
MKRRIIRIDESLCNGCGLCATACHEGAIGMVNGKAKLLREDYCDGLGDCLPACPMKAITFEVREAPAYNEAAVQKIKAVKAAADAPNCLQNFPVQIKLAPVTAPYFADADLLIAADCTAFAYGNFHRDFINGRVTLVGCPKLDGVNYSDKLTAILQNNDIRSVTLTRMTVPCCGGLSYAAETAIAQCGKDIPLQIVTISPDGQIIK